MKLPNGLIKCLERQGIDEKAVVFAAMADLDEEFRIADTIVAITDKNLIVARYPYEKKREVHLRGYSSWEVD